MTGLQATHKTLRGIFAVFGVALMVTVTAASPNVLLAQKMAPVTKKDTAGVMAQEQHATAEASL